MQALIIERTVARLGDVIAARAPDVEVVAWHADGTFSIDGVQVPRERVAPCIGWVSADVFAANAMRSYGDALLGFDSLEFVQSANAGLEAFPLYAKLAQAGVRIAKSGAQSIAIAEFVMCYCLMHAQRLDKREAARAERGWPTLGFDELWHSTFLVVGYGHIGRNIARRAKAFDASVIAVRASGRSDEYADEVVTLADLHACLPRADFVVLACPATEATAGIAGADFFAAMKPTSLLVNIARGALLDEVALVEALDAGRPAHAVLDVFETEPLPDSSPLWTHPKITPTTHTSFAGRGTRERGDALFLDNLERFANGQSLRDEVDREATARMRP